MLLFVCLQTLTAEAVQSINAYKVERNLFISEVYTGLRKSIRFSKKERLSIPLRDKASHFIHAKVSQTRLNLFIRHSIQGSVKEISSGGAEGCLSFSVDEEGAKKCCFQMFSGLLPVVTFN
jgi:hypothetical protein